MQFPQKGKMILITQFEKIRMKELTSTTARISLRMSSFQSFLRFLCGASPKVLGMLPMSGGWVPKSGGSFPSPGDESRSAGAGVFLRGKRFLSRGKHPGNGEIDLDCGEMTLPKIA
jgi:hypothetical protein